MSQNIPSDQPPQGPTNWGQPPMPAPQPRQPSWGQQQPPKAPRSSTGQVKTILTHGAAVIVSLIIGAAISAGGSSSSASPQPTVTVHDTTTVTATPKEAAPAPTVTVTKTVKPKAPAAPKTATISGDGTYKVGSEMKAGTYTTSGSADSSFPCYWARLKNASGDFNAIIANGNPQGHTSVTIRSSDGYFETTGCNSWKKTG